MKLEGYGEKEKVRAKRRRPAGGERGLVPSR